MAPLRLCVRGETTHFSLAEILVLADTADAGRMAPPASTGISARMKYLQGQVSRVNVHAVATVKASAVEQHEIVGHTEGIPQQA